MGGLVLPAVLLLSAAPEAAVVTKRLRTGLSSPQASDDLPQAWAAPIGQAPTIDGRLDDRAWDATRPVPLGKLERYGEASPPSTVRFLHRGGILYVGATLSEPYVGKLKRSTAKHDGSAWNDDSVELFLQPRSSDGYYQLVIGASGAVYDRRGHGDPSEWDSKTKAEVTVGPDGWSLEAAIPMASLGLVGPPTDGGWSRLPR